MTLLLPGQMGDQVPGSQLRICRGCGCDDLHACEPPELSSKGGCFWVLLDIAAGGGPAASGICSECAEQLGWNGYAMASIVAGIEARLIETRTSPS